MPINIYADDNQHSSADVTCETCNLWVIWKLSPLITQAFKDQISS